MVDHMLGFSSWWTLGIDDLWLLFMFDLISLDNCLSGSHMHGGQLAIIARVNTTPRVVQIMHSETPQLPNSLSPEVLDKDG
jgi:hypothetical protein